MGVGLAAPAVDLRPAGDAGLDAMAGEIAVHCLVINLRLGLGVDRVRARADQRQVALDGHVDELRQLVEARLADETADTGDARVVLGDELARGGVGLVGVHRAELVDLDQVVVEAVALLLEEHRPAAVELDENRDHRHHRRQADEQQAADDPVEQPFHHHVPVGDRAVEHVDHRHAADVGIGARAELQLVGVGGEPDVDRQHPQLLQHLQDAAFRRDRQREDHQVDAGAARELDQVVDAAELALAGAFGAAAVVAAVVEEADDLDAGVLLPAQFLDHLLAHRSAADDDGAAGEAAFARPLAHDLEQHLARDDERAQAGGVEAAEPEAGELVAGLGEERGADGDEEHHRPGGGEPHVLLLVAAEGLHLIDVGDLEGEHRRDGDAEGGDEIRDDQIRLQPEIEGEDDHAHHHHQRELRHAHEAGEHDGRDRRRGRTFRDGQRLGRQRALRFGGRLGAGLQPLEHVGGTGRGS